MEDEKLITLVRKYQHLYDLSHPKYMDSAKKDLAWKDISEQLSQPAALCKQRWQSLRDAYRRALNKRKSKSGQSAKMTKKWKYQDEMAFLAAFFQERQNQNSVSSDDEVSIKNEDDTNSESLVAYHYQPHDMNAEKPSGSNAGDSVKAEELNKLCCSKHTNVPQEFASVVFMANLLQERNKDQTDEMDRFFLSISGTVKTFTPYMQAIAKHKIFSIVSEMEIQQLAPSTFVTSSPQ